MTADKLSSPCTWGLTAWSVNDLAKALEFPMYVGINRSRTRSGIRLN